MIKWAIELGEYDISYQPRSAIKAQALAEFINEATLMEENEGNWLLHADGSSTLAGSGAGIVLTSPEGSSIWMVLAAGAKNLIASFDSQLVTNQVEGRYEIDTYWRKSLMDYPKKFLSTLSPMSVTEEGKNILQEIHEGACGSHIGGMALQGAANSYWRP
ncbi:UNVERIFIED_CONTAM: hypothetical protein Slati_4236500 [Sesamum latifolium]|uniref:Uncharacterized protein n=1 Tax=Sesamum latifolium TaxID=2727402 RepID=A0AAW2TAY5_9LAMI